MSAGHAILDLLTRRTFRLAEGATLAFGLGVLLFFFGMFLGGLLHLYGRAFFVAWPLLMLAAGRKWLLREPRRLYRLLRQPLVRKPVRRELI